MIFLVAMMFWGACAELPDASVDGIAKVKSWSQMRLEAANRGFQNSRHPSPQFWGEQIVYLIQADRFNDGDPRNNELNIEPAQQKGDISAIFDFHHGGDIEGIIQRLDYLQNLGITTLWITPVLKHSGAYHGYCTSDPTEIDPSFGRNDDFRRLVSEAHRRNIFVVMDVVVNHMCDRDTFYSREPNHMQCAVDFDRANWSGEASGSKGQGELQFSPSFFKPLKSPYFFNRCGANSTAEMQGTGPAAIYGDFVNGMFDFDTRNQDFQEIFTNLYKFWIAYADVDGFRLDAAKHVSEDFVAYFSTQTREYARSIGKKNFFTIGEVAGPSDWIGRRLGKMFSDPNHPNNHGSVPVTLTSRLFDLKPTYQSNAEAPYPGLTAVFDFAHGGTAVDVLQNNRPPSALEEQFQSQYHRDIAAQNDSRLSWNLLEIHDWRRFASRNPHSMEKSILGMAYLAFAEEAPVIYYGMEQGFNGDCHGQCGTEWTDALSRQDMFIGGMTRLGSTVPLIDELMYIGRPQSAQRQNHDPYLNTDHALYRSSRAFLTLRRSCSALKYGETIFRWVEKQKNDGLLAFSRFDRLSGQEALVVLNTSSQQLSIPDMQVETRNAAWRNLLKGGKAASSGNTVHFDHLDIAGNGVMLFVPENNLGEFDSLNEMNHCRQ